MVELRRVHLIVEKNILRYLKATIDYGCIYTSNQEIILHVYADSDWVGSVADQKSTSGCCFGLGSTVIAWFSRK
jgi:hypothetical protein